MKQFGYALSHDNTLDMDRLDMGASRLIYELEPSAHQCIGCGSCTATCSTGHFREFNIRRIQTLLRRGEVESLLTEISQCMYCGKCQLVCPRGVNLRNLILVIHNLNEGGYGKL